MRPDGPRDPVAGPDSGPEPPFPIKLSGPVIKGFGRGSKELGIPTANIPPGPLDQHPSLSTGVYYGFVGLLLPTPDPTISTSTSSPSTTSTNPSTHPAVLSIGYNPFYANTTRSIEIHILSASLPADFYHAPLNLLILGFIRPEYDYVSKESLIEDIMLDCEVARRSLSRDAYRGFEEEGWLRDFGWVESLGGVDGVGEKGRWEERVKEVEREVGVN